MVQLSDSQPVRKCQPTQLSLPFLAQPQVSLRVQLSPSGQEAGSQHMVAAAEQLHCSEHPPVHDISPIYREQ